MHKAMLPYTASVVLYCVGLSCSVLCCSAWASLPFTCPALPCPALPCPALPCPTLPALPCQGHIHGGCPYAGIAHVTDEFKITKLEIYYDPNEIMAQMVGSSGVCPVMHSTKHERTSHGKDKYEVPLENQLGESLQSKLTVSEDNAGKSLTSGSGAAKGQFDNAEE